MPPVSSSGSGPVRYFFKGNSTFSIYEEMAAQLQSDGWRPERSTERLGRCSLVLGDRFDMPYHLLCTLRPYSTVVAAAPASTVFRSDGSTPAATTATPTAAAVGDGTTVSGDRSSHSSNSSGPGSPTRVGSPPPSPAATATVRVGSPPPATSPLLQPTTVATKTVKPFVNYFRGSHRLTLKAAMAELIPKTTPWMPPTFVLAADPTKKRGVRDERADLSRMMLSEPEGSVWIVKPSSGCKGVGIELCRRYEEVLQLLAMRAPTDVLVAQRYIERPLLLRGGRKFDIRLWALLVGDEQYSAYAFHAASCRTASVPFSLNNLHNKLIHLTNHCLQEQGSQYGRFELGNELWLTDLYDHVDWQSLRTDADCAASSSSSSLSLLDVPTREEFVQSLTSQMDRIVVETLAMVREEIELSPDVPFQCFQLFGYDFIVSVEPAPAAAGANVGGGWSLRVKLLEINGSPGSADALLHDMVEGMRQVLSLGGVTGNAAAASETASLWRKIS